MIKNTALVLSMLGLLLTASFITAETSTTAISGDYVEIRSCDVFTGSCFANGEVGLLGKEAILTWSIDAGEWEGVDLAGLKVIAVVKANATLGDTNHDPYPARSVLIVDQAANDKQRAALAQFARHMAGQLLEDVNHVEAAPIEVHVASSDSAEASVEVDKLVSIQTRAITYSDLVCGAERIFYPPLSAVSDVTPAFTEIGSFQGEGLGVTFSEVDRRSAFIARFNVPTARTASR